MNQTKKRLSIINLAISITDLETIQLQILKLGLLASDDKVQEILAALRNESYAQAQTLIKIYIDTPNNEILQRTFQKEKERKEKALIGEFDLFAVHDDKATQKESTVIHLEEMLEMAEEKREQKARKVHEEINFDALLSVKEEDIMPDNIEIELSASPENDFWDKDDAAALPSDPVGRDTFFDTPKEDRPVEEIVTENRSGFTEKEDHWDTAFDALITRREEEETSIAIEEMEPPLFTNEIKKHDDDEEEETKEDEFFIETIIDAKREEAPETEQQPVRTTEPEAIPEPEAIQIIDLNETNLDETHTEENKDKEDAVFSYDPIPYIDQKLRNMLVQYPPREASQEQYQSVTQSLHHIASKTYTESEIEEMIEALTAFKEERPSEAAQLLLLAASTESKYAQFQLARALFKGEILEKNPAEAFTLMHRLAVNEDYPEAICDLAQFYEYGVGIGKDKHKAETLYREAMEQGIKRAIPHVERVQKKQNGFFAFLTK